LSFISRSLFSDLSLDYYSIGFDVIPTADVELNVAEPSRRGAPMTLIRGGEERDLAAIVAMEKARASPARFHLDRSADFVQALSRRRDCLQGSAPPARANSTSS
jgi:hypothetical protein